jgi:replicative DNA helicase
MTLVQERIAALQQARQARLSGKMTLVPLYEHFPRLGEYVPGFFRGSLSKILSGTGVGKTKLAKYLSVIIPYELSKTHNLKFHTLYFALEESKEEFVDTLIVMMLKMKYNIIIDRLQLNSYFKKVLDDETIAKVANVQSEVEDIMKHVTVYDDIHNPTGIFKACKKHADDNGTHHYQDGKILTATGETLKLYDRYEPNDPEQFTIVVVDHVSLLEGEYDSQLQRAIDEREAMQKWSSTYCLKGLAKKFKYICLNVQQVNMSSDDLDHYKARKLEPAMSDAGDNKKILRDDQIIFALFDPARYGLDRHNGYNLRSIDKDAYRSLSVLKNRYGRSNIQLGLLFEGATGRFEELPTPKLLE